MEYNRPNIESSALPLAHCVRLRIGSFALINEKRIGSPLIRGNNFNGYNFANVEPFPGFLSPHRALFNLRVNTKNRRKKKKEERKRDSTKRRLDTTGPYSRNLYERRERYESSSPGVCNCAIRQRERARLSKLLLFAITEQNLAPCPFRADNTGVLCGQRLRKRRCR